MGYKYGRRSRRELIGVHPELTLVCHQMITIVEVDCGVYDGIRTDAEQREHVANGSSKTMRSRHLKQLDGFGHAVDMVPWIAGKYRWEWPPLFKVFEAMRQAAGNACLRQHGYGLVWGGCWLDVTDPTVAGQSPEALMERYRLRKEAKGKRAFFDGPHYELLVL